MLPCFVINLERAVERRADISRQLDEIGLPYEIIPAVDARDLSQADLDAHVDKRRAIRPLVPGEIGCALSHRKVYQKIVSEEIPAALILEDDAQLVRPDSADRDRDRDELMRVLEKIETLMNTDDPLVVLLTYVRRYRKRSLRLTDRHRLSSVVGGAHRGHGYVVSRAAAENLLGGIYPFRLPCDHWDVFAAEGLIGLKAVTPYCVGLSDFALMSSIGDERYVLDERLERKKPGIVARTARIVTNKLLFPVAKQNHTW